MIQPRSVVGLVLVLMSTMSAAGGDTPAVAVSAREALGQLKAGNDRFARNASRPVSLSVNRRRELAGAQHPFAMVLSCADSRVPPELIFNTGLGDVLVVRTAAGVVDRSVLATVEHGAEHLKIPLLVVMGHESCDVVQAAASAERNQSANLEYLLKAIQAAKRQTGQDRDGIKALVLANVEQVVNDTLSKSPLLQGMVDEGRVQIVGAYYEPVSGRVVFSEPVSSGATPGAHPPTGHPAAGHPTAAHP